MNEELAELATSAATALVSAMGTDLWQEAKRLMSRVLAHGGSQRRELTAALDMPSRAASAHDFRHGGDTAGLVHFWNDALAELLAQNPALTQELRDLASLRLPERSATPAQLNSATNSGVVFAVQHGVQHIASTATADDPEARPRADDTSVGAPVR